MSHSLRGVPGTAGTSGFIGEFPGKDSRLVDIASDESVHIVLVSRLHESVRCKSTIKGSQPATYNDFRIRVEPVVVSSLRELAHVDIHTTII